MTKQHYQKIVTQLVWLNHGLGNFESRVNALLATGWKLVPGSLEIKGRRFGARVTCVAILERDNEAVPVVEEKPTTRELHDAD